MSKNRDQDEIVDLQGSKILEWLLDRKKLPQHWKRNAPALKKQIDEALKTSPPTNIKLPESHNPDEDENALDYFKCQLILKDCLEAPNGGAKTLFGGYSNNATNKWNEVIKAYQKDFLYVGESCQTFTQAINYEIPNLKKIVEKSIKSLDDINRKEQEYTKSRASAQSNLKRACQDLGIKGEKIREEIEELPKSLETIFENVMKFVSNENLAKSIDFYQEVIKATNGELDSELLPVSRFLIKHGNITLGEREAILDPNYKPPKPKETISVDKISENIEVSGGGGGINWDVDDQVSSMENASMDIPTEIKWDEDFSLIDSSTPQDIIDDFSMMDAIEIVDESSPVFTSSSNQFTVEQSSQLEAIDGNSKVLENPFESILGDRTLRNQFLDEMYELEIFLKHRSVEMSAPEHIFGIDQIHIESTNIDQCKLYLKHISDIIASMTNHKIKHILEIKSSKKYIDRIVLQFNQKQGNITKYTQTISDLELKRKDINQTLGDARLKLEQLTKNTKALKSKLEGVVGDVLDGKKVNIMIQNVF